MTAKRFAALTIVWFLLGLGWTGPLWAEEQGLAGHWEGKLEISGTSMEINVDFAIQKDGSWTGDISIPAQNARNLTLTAILLAGRVVSFEIADVPGSPSFKGTIGEDGNSIAGTFTQSGKEFPFELRREAGLKARAKKSLSGFDDLVERGLKELIVPGVAVAVVVEDETILAKGYGFAALEDERPMTVDTLLAIGSSTKAFTTFTLGTLVDEGKLEWNAPVRTYIPWFKLYDTFATLHMTPVDLITHRSGLPRHDLVWYNNFESGREDLVRRLAYLEPTADLRERFQYNNLMFLTAGYLTEVLTGKSWEDSVRTQVLEPLGMTRTNFSVDESKKDLDYALPYRAKDKKLERIPFRNISTVGPAGSINSTVNEMSRWVMVHLGEGKLQDREVMNPQTLQKMHLSHMPMGNTPAISEIGPGSYGLGWMIDAYRGHRRVHHGGNIDGFSAMVSLFPQDGIGFVVLSNKNGCALPELLIRHAADLILGYESKDWIGEVVKQREKGEKVEKEAEEKKAARRIKGTQPSHPPDDYTGTYFHPGYGKLLVGLEGGKPAFTYNGIRAPLEHWHYDTYNALEDGDPTFEDMKINFRTNAAGRIAGLEVPFEATLDPIVFYKQPDPLFFDPEYLKEFMGRYQLIDQIVTISLKGSVLTATFPGQPSYELVPDLGDEFHFKQVKIITVMFKLDAQGGVTAMEVVQPGGVYEFKRIK